MVFLRYIIGKNQDNPIFSFQNNKENKKCKRN